MKLLIVVGSLHGGGAEYVARTWMAELAGRGHEVEAVLTGKAVDETFQPRGVPVLSLAKERGQLSKIVRLRRILARGAYDATLSLQMHSNLLLISAALLQGGRRPKLLVSERNLVTPGLRRASLAHRAKVCLARMLYKRADNVVAISHPVAAELLAGFHVPQDKIVVIPNPATTKVRTRTPARIDPAPKSNGLQLIFASRLVEQKRPVLAVEVAAELQQRGNSVRLLCFGEGPLKQNMQSAAARLSVDLRHFGWVEDWFAYSDDESVFLMTSAREGFGNVLVEAAAAGLPSVAVSTALGVADAVVPGLTGELAVDSSVTAIADAVERARDMPSMNVDGWLKRFNSSASVDLLELAITSTK